MLTDIGQGAVLEEKMLKRQASCHYLLCTQGHSAIPLAEVDMEVDGVPVRLDASLWRTLPHSHVIPDSWSNRPLLCTLCLPTSSLSLYAM